MLWGFATISVKTVVTKPDFLSFNRDFTLNFDLEGQKTLFATGTSILRVPKRAQKAHIFCPSGGKNPSVAKRFLRFFGKTLGEMP